MKAPCTARSIRIVAEQSLYIWPAIGCHGNDVAVGVGNLRQCHAVFTDTDTDTVSVMDRIPDHHPLPDGTVVDPRPPGPPMLRWRW